ncbi:uncharacterized protein LOC128550166 [Mercenaria mercenaria]|uniref:uncharacterized protein LOC128550166 n=1 Tax=Mercenaria mercenaria TaxID=6596 RepID=UPI00234EC82E|nr:uncharacterized protein LOC128550166 [Mercenaria mercenaria]
MLYFRYVFSFPLNDLFNTFSDVYSLTFGVYQSADKAILGDNPFTLSCTYTIGPLEQLYSVELMRKRESDPDFTTIVTFQNPSSALNVTYTDTSLESRTVATKPTVESRTATLVFNKIECDDKATYKWSVIYTDGTNKNVEETSTVVIKDKNDYTHRMMEKKSQNYIETRRSEVSSKGGRRCDVQTEYHAEFNNRNIQGPVSSDYENPLQYEMPGDSTAEIHQYTQLPPTNEQLTREH